MSKPISIEEVFPIYKVENNCIISRKGDVTMAFAAILPEIFTLSDKEYEDFHNVWAKAIKVLPNYSVFHKQDFFYERKYKADMSATDFLSLSSERHFDQRPYIDHQCYMMITLRANMQKLETSASSSLFRKSILPQQVSNPQKLQDFMDAVSQFNRILSDSGFIKITQVTNAALVGSNKTAGLLERYCFLTDEHLPLIRDIQFSQEWKIGDQYVQMFSLGDVEHLPALCGSRMNYDRYSTDKSKYSIGFSAPLGLLLQCNHIYNQFIFIEDAQKTIKGLEARRLRLQSLATYSRENAISRDFTNDFLNEAISNQRLPIKAHFNVMLWSSDKAVLKENRTLVSSALAQMDAVAKQETYGAPQLFWAGLPGNESDCPSNDMFDTFAEQAVCFFNVESNYRDVV